MTVIKRVEQSEYRLLTDGGDLIETYTKAAMTHPDDWIQDARDAGESVSGPYDWEYVDGRDIQE